MTNEDSLQITVADWLRVQYPGLLFWHTPNGGSRPKRQNKKGEWYCPQGNKLERMGVKAGVPDIFIPIPQKMKFIVTAEQLNGFEDFWKNADPSTFQPLMLNHIPHHPIPLLRRGYLGFFAELKIKPNKLTKTQAEMIEKLSALGYYCCVCYSLDEFMKEWESYAKA